MLLLVLYIFLSLAFFIVVQRRNFFLPIQSVILIALLFRLGIIFAFPVSDNFDLRWFIAQGESVLENRYPYSSNYFPFINCISAACIALSNSVDAKLLLRILYSVVDSIIPYVLFLVTKNKTTAFLYAVNPISLIVISLHGQMDSFPLLFILFGFHYLNLKNDILTAICMSFGIWTKPWPVFVLLPVLRRSKHVIFYGFLFLFPVLSVLIFSMYSGTSVMEILRPIKDYRGVYGVWGMGSLMFFMWPTLDEIWIRVARRLFLVGFALFSLLFKTKNVYDENIGILLFLLSFSLTFGAQWLIWIVPFLLIRKPKAWLGYIILSTVYLFITFSVDVFPEIAYTKFWTYGVRYAGIFTWLFVVYMFFVHVVSFQKSDTKDDSTRK